MTPSHAAPGRKVPRAVLWSLAVVLLGLAIWLWRTGVASGAKPDFPAQAEHRLHAPPSEADTANAGNDADRKRQIRDIAAYWAEHKAHLHRLLAVDYPAAVARRNAAAPDYPAVETFGKALERDIASNYEKASPELKAKLNDLSLENGFGFCVLLMQRLVIRDWNDATPVTDNLSISDLTRQMLADPAQVADLRKMLADEERLAFHDEITARQVEAMETGAELVAHVTASQAHYDAWLDQAMDDDIPDPELRAYFTGSTDSSAFAPPVEEYLKRHNQEVQAILDEYHNAERDMNEGLLAQASADDEEARRLLTEWKDLKALKPVTINDP